MMDKIKQGKKSVSDQIREADMLRALDVVVESWENDDLDIDAMTDQLEAMCEVADGLVTFDEFLVKTGLTPPRYH